MSMDCSNQEKQLILDEQLFPPFLYVMSGSERCTMQSVEGDTNENETTALDIALENALEIIDRAMLALHLSHNLGDDVERISSAGLALDGFRAALTALDEVEDEVRSTETWHVWHEEAQRGIAVAREL